MHKVRVIVPHVGGGFGGKLQTVLEPYCVLLAHRTGRPVKMVLSREEEFFLGKPRSAGVLHLKTGVTHDGLLVARQARMYFDTGFACHPRSCEIAPTIVRGPYNIPHVRFERIACIPTRWAAAHFGGRGAFRHILPANRRLTSSAGNWAWIPSPFGAVMAYRKATSRRWGAPAPCGHA